MIGYTRKVGLRKPGTLAWARAQLNDPHLTTDEWDEFIEYQSAHLTPAQVDAFAPWFADMRRPLKIHDPGVHKPFNDDGADPHWSDEDRIALGVECLLCHNAAAGHDRTVPPDHDCGDWERVIDCAECDGLTLTEQEADRNAEEAREQFRAEREGNWSAEWLEQQQREASLIAAQRKVASIPVDHRRYLEGEFQRAEQEAAAIMRHGRATTDETEQQ